MHDAGSLVILLLSIFPTFIWETTSYRLKKLSKRLTPKLNNDLMLAFGTSLSPDPFFAFLFSFLFVRDTNLAHPIKNCSLHSLV